MKRLASLFVMVAYMAITQTSSAQALIGEDSTMVRNFVRTMYSDLNIAEGIEYTNTGKVLVFNIENEHFELIDILKYQLNDDGRVVKYSLFAHKDFLSAIYKRFRTNPEIKEDSGKFYEPDGTVWKIQQFRQIPYIEVIAEVQ